MHSAGVLDFLKEKKDHELGITPSTNIDNVNVGELCFKHAKYNFITTVRPSVSPPCLLKTMNFADAKTTSSSVRSILRRLVKIFTLCFKKSSPI